jgi:general secretion pathway protein B
MSFILDALKKSEIERQRQTVPGPLETRVPRRRSALPRWAIALGVLFGINLLVLSFVLVRKGAPAAPAPPSQAAAAIGAEAAPSAARHFSPLDAPPEYAPEIPVATSDPVSSAPAVTPIRATLAGLAVPPKGTARAAGRSDPLLSDADANADSQEVLPTMSELNLTGAQALPEMHLDVHVYATTPAERFVYVNMRRYHEGNMLQEGPRLERIRRDGVVLDYQGLRFLLPRHP